MRRLGIMLAAVLLLGAAPARADFDPLGGGVTRIELAKSFRSFLARNRIQLTPAAPAARHRGALVLPVSGGHLDPTIRQGEIEQDGALVFRNSRKRVPVRNIVVKTTYSPLVAKVGGSQLKVVTAATIRSKRKGFATIISATELNLTAKLATRLNKKLRPSEPFAAGQLLGDLVGEIRPQVTSVLPTGRATLDLDPAFLAKLDEHFVSVNPIFPAEHIGGSFTLPIIAGGALAPDGSLGTLRTGGDLEFLKLGAGQVFWHELWFDLGQRSVLAEADLEPTPAFPGKLGQVPVLDLQVGAVGANPAARTISLSSAPLTMPDSTAAMFNAAFASSDFKPGELVGALAFVAQGQ